MEKKLFEALQTIKELCVSQGATCKGCPLNISNDSACDFFDEAPEHWDLEALIDIEEDKETPGAATPRESK